MNNSILVLGATGTLGAHITLHLKNKGYNIVAVGNRDSDNNFFEEYDIPYYSVDITDKRSFSKLPNKFDSIIHFAGSLPASMSGYYPEKYLDTIIKGTFNVLEFARINNIRKIIFPQSLFDISHLFGSKKPIPEDAERKIPSSGDHTMYVIAKNTAVEMIEHYYREYGIKRFILRLSRVYLYHPNPYTYINGKKSLISDRLLIEKAINGEDIEMWGNPKQRLETICIKDFLQIVEKCVEANIDGGIYNIGSGGSTLEERIRDIIDVFCSPPKVSNIIYMPEKDNGTEFTLDISKTQKELGYNPKYTWKMYLEDFKKDREEQKFKKLWGAEIPIIK